MKANLSTDPGKDLKKFLFDGNNFDAGAKPDPSKPVYTEDQARLMRDGAASDARNKALAEAKAAQEAQIAGLLDQISALLLSLTAQEEERELKRMADATRLAMKIVHKLMPGLVDKFALPEIERVILETLETRKDEPRIAVIVPTAHLESLRARIDGIAIEKGYAGKMILVADDNLSPSNCRVEWADGGAERSFERLYAQIEGEFAKTLSAIAQTEPQNTKQS
jgi:flagellar assembly protein FliH